MGRSPKWLWQFLKNAVSKVLQQYNYSKLFSRCWWPTNKRFRQTASAMALYLRMMKHLLCLCLNSSENVRNPYLSEMSRHVAVSRRKKSRITGAPLAEKGERSCMIVRPRHTKWGRIQKKKIRWKTQKVQTTVRKRDSELISKSKAGGGIH